MIIFPRPSNGVKVKQYIPNNVPNIDRFIMFTEKMNNRNHKVTQNTVRKAENPQYRSK